MPSATSKKNIGLIDDRLFQEHRALYPHPENPQRLQAIDRQLEAQRLKARLTLLPLREATDDELRLVHTHEHLEFLRSTAQQPQVQIDADTYACARSNFVARYAAGSLLNAVDRLTDGTLDSAVALIRPPGHHALADRAMGFCLINNVAVAAAYALAHKNCRRVAIVDWDVHHGNGTQQIFYERADVLYVSTHQSPLYPGTGSIHEVGTTAGFGFNLNFPLPAFAEEAHILELYEQIINPTLALFAPDLIIVSAGYDAHNQEPLAQLSMSTSSFTKLANAIESIKEQFKSLKTLYVLEGGYNPEALAASVTALLQFLLDDNRSKPVKQPISKFNHHILHAFNTAVRQQWDWPSDNVLNAQ